MAVRKRFRKRSMVSRRKRRFQYRRRRFNKKSRRPSLFAPAYYFVKLRYMDVDTPTFNTTIAGTIVLVNTYKVNSPYDVNNSILSSTVPGFKEWANIYQRYRVMAAKISTEISVGYEPPDAGSSATNIGNLVCGVYIPPVNTVAPGGWSDYMSLRGEPYSKQAILQPHGGSRDLIRMKVYANIGKLFGNRRQVLSDDNFDSDVSHNPSYVMSGFVYVMNSVDSELPYPNVIARARTEVTMYIKFYQRRQQFF